MTADNEKWITRYLNLAKHISEWSKDPGTKVGVIAVGRFGQILSQGYNGFPRGIADTQERLVDRNTKLAYTVHAEMNCVFNAGLSGVSLAGSDLYVYGLPVCHECAPGIIQTGVSRVFMCYPADLPERWKESTELAQNMLTEAEVEFWLCPYTVSSSDQTQPSPTTLVSSETAVSNDSASGSTTSESTATGSSTLYRLVGSLY